MHHRYVAFPAVSVCGVDLICVDVFAKVDLASHRTSEWLVVQTVSRTKTVLNDGLSPLLHFRLPPPISPHHTCIVHPSGVEPRCFVGLIFSVQIPQEYQRSLVIRIGVETQSQVHQQLAILPLLHILPVTMRKLSTQLRIRVPTTFDHDARRVFHSTTFQMEEE